MGSLVGGRVGVFVGREVVGLRDGEAEGRGVGLSVGVRVGVCVGNE